MFMFSLLLYKKWLSMYLSVDNTSHVSTEEINFTNVIVVLICSLNHGFSSFLFRTDLPNCTNGERRCSQNGRCIPVESLCDLKSDCPDGSDELLCSKLLCRIYPAYCSIFIYIYMSRLVNAHKLGYYEFGNDLYAFHFKQNDT